MIDVLDIVREIAEKDGLDSLAKSYELDYGTYIRVGSKKVSEEDVYTFNSKTDKTATIDLYKWFSERAFFEGMLNLDSNKIVLQSGILRKKIHSVTPYAMIFKAENIDLFDSPELLEEHFKLVASFSEGSEDVKATSRFFYEKVLEIKELINKEGSPVPSKGKLLLFTDRSLAEYERAYIDYFKVYGFGKTDKPILKDGKFYGRPCLGINLDSKKLINITSDIRKIPYLISLEDNLLLSYISKLRKSIEEIISEKTGEAFTLELNLCDVSDYGRDSSKDVKRVYRSLSPLSKNTGDSIESIKTQGDVLEIIEKNLTRWTLSPAMNRRIQTSSDTSDYYKEASRNIDNIRILQQIISDRDLFKHYFNGGQGVDITRSLEKILKLIYEYELGTDISFELLKKKFDTILSVMDYISEKENYRNMAINLNDLMVKFSQQKKEKVVIIENDSEFYFMSGQLIRYLASQSQSNDKKADLMGNVMVKKRDKVKDLIIDMYDKYSHNLPLYSESYVNLLFQQIIGYKIGEKDENNSDNWYYYQAGLAGKNIMYVKNDTVDKYN